MTTVKFKQDCIEIKGHSNYSTLGKDIVCSSISTATMFYVNAEELTYKQNNGYISIDTSKASKHNTRAYRDILEHLAKEYPEHITCIEV